MKKNVGTSFDSWLEEEGIRQEVTACAIKRVLARQVATARAQDGLTKTEMWPRPLSGVAAASLFPV